ncbi:hypothetical protein KUCAC02_029780, partial [Chaenocephalus aceratus]
VEVISLRSERSERVKPERNGSPDDPQRLKHLQLGLSKDTSGHLEYLASGIRISL